ncbi:hypothetical protein L6164_007846 [Bauhinia variegata]|uniref:Uncharacterized protein n=1 Tax=Bauhinia variegata TaxID=167791 RepID=A0ACB9PE15_BAUVA|nr:hypothetical protein L6164_007846 [Bauhinia variegata]
MEKYTVARTVVGILGNIISLGLFFYPTPTFIRIVKNKTVEQFKPDPYIASLFNCAFWVLYALPFVHSHSILIITINSIGVVIEITYLCIFYFYATHEGRKKVEDWVLIGIVFFTAITLVTLLELHGTKRRTMVVGIICDVFNVLTYSAPLTIMAKVIRTKSVKYMPFWLPLASFLNGVAWVIYALFPPFDIYVLVCNALGVVSGIIQLILYTLYCSCLAGDDGDDIER